ncbi:MAG: ELWxxDGT repeat protein [Chitinophagaceae bacterium]
MYFTVNNTYSGGLWKTDGTGAGTLRVKEISGIQSLVKINDLFFFNAYDGNTSTQQLWKSDGTEAGTVIVKIWPNYQIDNLVSSNGILYFIYKENANELWKSDGTEAGTIPLKWTSSIQNITDVNGTLFFTVNENIPPYRYTLWKSNGTVAGTVLIKDIYAGSGFTSYNNFYNADGTLFFVGSDGVNGAELWKSDGTDAGTIMIKDIEPGFDGSNIHSFATANNIVYFFTYTSADGISLWKSDGTTTGTGLVKDLNDNSSPDYLTNVNGLLFFKGYDDINGEELWKSDGTDAGTVLVKDIFPGTESGDPSSLINVNGVLFFSANNEVAPPPGTGPFDCNTSGELWKSDGTEAGTVLVKDIYRAAGGSAPQGFVEANGVLFFKANNGINGRELWKSDGTTNGTLLVKDIFRTAGSSPQKFTAMNGKVYFTAFNGDGGPAYARGREVYQTDGTLSGTAQSTWIFTLGGSSPREIANHNGELFISATNGSHGYELYKTDGLGLYSGGTTSKIKEINQNLGSGERGSNPSHLTSVNQFLFFSATDGTNGYELWKSDGTGDGTVMVKNINPGAGDSNPANLLNVNGVLYFTADNGTDGIELWKSDGTDAGTVMIKNINVGSNSSSPVYLTAINAVLYFAADDGVNGIELWKSDGTEAGTALVKNINAAGNNSNPASLTNVNGVLYFSADNGINGVEVWKSNGTDAGTVLVKDIFSGPASSNPDLFTNLNGIVLFTADDGIAGRELWGSNGTATGTILIKDIQPGAAGSNPTALKRAGSNVFFAANDGVAGSEAWLSNGAELGTRLVSEIEPGIIGSDPTDFFEYGAKVLVAATNTMFGSEVWIADAPADIPVLNATIAAAGLAICTGQNAQLKANKGVGYTYQWEKAGVNIAGAVQSNYTATLPGAYTVVVTDATGASATSPEAVVTVVAFPLANVAAAGPVSFCAGKNVLLKAVSSTGYTYQWKKSGVNIVNANSSNYTATAAGTYSVVVSNAAGCSNTSAVINVTVNNVPQAAVVAATALTFCEGRSVQLKAISGTGYTYQWKRAGVDIAGATLSNYNAVATGIYIVTVTNASGCSATSAGFNVVVKPLPLAAITPAGSTTFCADKNVLLKANTGTSYTYQWIRGATPIPDAIQPSYAATTAGQYMVTVTNASGCSVTSAAIPVSVNPLPAALITPAGPLTFCAGQTVSLKANTGTNYTYQWKKSGINIPDATLVNYTAAASGVYSVVVTNAGGCSVTSPAVTVTVNTVPLAAVVAAGATSFCAGKNVLLKAINGTGYTYQWRKNGINIPQEITSSYTATSTGVYSVVVTNATGCSTASSVGISVAVTTAPLATVAIAGPATFCEGKNVLLKAIAGTGYTYQWKKNGVNIAGQTQSNYTAIATGLYTVTVTNAEGCSTLSGAINVTVTPAPVTAINANGPLIFPQGGNVILSAAAATGNTYQWKKDGVNITGAISESYSASVSGAYTVVITNGQGCQAVSQETIVSVTQTRPITKAFNEGNDFVKIYPNPLYRNDYLNIDWSISTADKWMLVTIYDMTGRKISSQLLRPYDKKISIRGASGTYMVECRWGVNQRKIFSVIKIE